jgi:hypothetical protein
VLAANQSVYFANGHGEVKGAADRVLCAGPPEKFPACIAGATRLQDEFRIRGIAVYQANTRKAAITVRCVAVALIVQCDSRPIEIAQD